MRAAAGAWDYDDRFEMPAGTTTWSAERWARATFEGAPAVVRGLLALGWRLGLGLRLGGGARDARVLGWPIVESSRAALEDARLVQSTLVRYESAAAAPVWRVVSLLHRAVMPRLLARASRASRATS